MVSTDSLFYLSGALLTAATLWRAAALDNEVDNFSRQLRHDAARLLELRYRKEAYRRVQSAQRITESVFDTNAINLRRMYMNFAKIPFGFLESIPTICKTAKIVRKVHDLITESAFRSIFVVNRATGKLTRDTINYRWGQCNSNPEGRYDDSGNA